MRILEYIYIYIYCNRQVRGVQLRILRRKLEPTGSFAFFETFCDIGSPGLLHQQSSASEVHSTFLQYGQQAC